MTIDQAVQHLQTNNSADVRFVTKDATLSHYLYKRVWLDEQGSLIMSHPTGRGTCPAPKDGRYELHEDENPAQEDNGEPYHGHGEGW